MLRIGWAAKEAEIEVPVGYDKYGFAYRDILGSSVHASVRNDAYGGEPYGPGDIIGSMISLMETAKESTLSPEEDDAKEGENTLPLEEEESTIRFFKNGIDQGIAFRFKLTDFSCDIFPAVSIYGKGAVRANFGPDFEFPPPEALQWSSLA